MDDLRARGQYTVFAPTDAALAPVLGGEPDAEPDLSGLSAETLEFLTNVLLYHVAPGRRYAADVAASDRIRMLNGGFNIVTVDGTDVLIGDEEALVIVPNVEASNGVIHVIDAVLIP